MQVRLWGVRGSIAAPLTSAALRDKARALLAEARPEDLASPAAIDAYLDRSEHAWTYGGNTSCVEVSLGDALFVLDAGTGIRALGSALHSRSGSANAPIHLFFTHFHWDHICGFPFFLPIYQPGREIGIWSGRSDAERLLSLQMHDAHFPVKWHNLPSKLVCRQLPEDAATEIAGAQVRILPLIHPDKAYGYRIDHAGSSVVYLTDTEVSKHPDKVAAHYARFVEGADLVIVDAMYGFLDYHDHINFGHSTIFNFIDFFRDADIGELVIFHHDPQASDAQVTRLCADAARYKELIAPAARWRLSAARELSSWTLPLQRQRATAAAAPNPQRGAAVPDSAAASRP
jgi:phosphoribosyl 1,2-cyclic phosphodiesterase